MVLNTRKPVPQRKEALIFVPGCKEALTRFLALVTFFWDNEMDWFPSSPWCTGLNHFTSWCFGMLDTSSSWESLG